jgi:hypothetical protein
LHALGRFGYKAVQTQLAAPGVKSGDPVLGLFHSLASAHVGGGGVLALVALVFWSWWRRGYGAGGGCVGHALEQRWFSLRSFLVGAAVV